MKVVQLLDNTGTLLEIFEVGNDVASVVLVDEPEPAPKPEPEPAKVVAKIEPKPKGKR